MEEKNNQTMLLAVVAVVAIVIVGIGVFLLTNNNQQQTQTPTTPVPTPTAPTTTTPPTTTPEPSAPRESYTFDLSEQNGSGQSGIATIFETNGQVRVSIALENPTSVAEPAHIHVGQCPSPGAIQFPLSDVVDGISETTLETTMEALVASGDLAINVHKSAGELSTYYACGNLDF